MTVLAVLLLGNAAFNGIVWPRFFQRVMKDPRARDENGKATSFLIVHAVLIAVALVLALASLAAAVAFFAGVL